MSGKPQAIGMLGYSALKRSLRAVSTIKLPHPTLKRVDVAMQLPSSRKTYFLSSFSFWTRQSLQGKQKSQCLGRGGEENKRLMWVQVTSAGHKAAGLCTTHS